MGRTSSSIFINAAKLWHGINDNNLVNIEEHNSIKIIRNKQDLANGMILFRRVAETRENIYHIAMVIEINTKLMIANFDDNGFSIISFTSYKNNRTVYGLIDNNDNSFTYFGKPLKCSTPDQLKQKIKKLEYLRPSYSYKRLNCECVTLYLKCSNITNLMNDSNETNKKIINNSYYTKLLQ